MERFLETNHHPFSRLEFRPQSKQHAFLKQKMIITERKEVSWTVECKQSKKASLKKRA